MTFPTPRTPEFSRGGGAPVTSRIVDLPSGIVAGDLMVVVFQSSISTGGLTPPSGWALVSGSLGTAGEDGIYWKIAVGGETSATWTHNGSAASSWHVGMAFQGAQGPPEYTSNEASSSSTVNCPSITPSWGLADNLFCAINYWSDTGDYASTYPTNYTLMQANEAPTTTGYRTAARALAAASEDPPAQSSTGSMAVVRGITLAIRPTVASVAQSVSRGSYMMG